MFVLGRSASVPAFLLYIRKKMQFPSVIMPMANMKQAFTIIICVGLAASACQPGKKDSEAGKTGEETTATEAETLTLPEIQNNPIALKKLDSIPLPSLKDTVNKDETGKDSLKFTRLFQIAANRLCRAEKEKDYDELSSFTPASIIKFYKTKAAYIERMKINDEGRPVYDKILAGPIQKIAPATDDKGFSAAWYCLIPVRSYRKDGQGNEVVDMSWLGGQCDIKNKTVYFLNVTGLSREQIIQVMPDLTFVLDKK